jgi:hypothetical protein
VEVVEPDDDDVEPDDDEPNTVSFVGPLPPSEAAPAPAPPAPVTPMGGLRLASYRAPDPGEAEASSSFLSTARITTRKGEGADPSSPGSSPTGATRARRRPAATLPAVPGAAPAPTWRASMVSHASVSAAPSAGEAIDLIWADPASAPKLRRAFGDLLADLPAACDPEAAAVRVLAAGAQRDAAGLEDAMASAVGPDAGFRAPAVVVAGELRFAFDEVEALRALVSAVSPYAAGDAALTAAVDAARKLLATPAIPARAAERASLRVRDAFEAASRPIPPRALDAQVERTLLARRAYDRRALFGGDRLRARVALHGADAACPVYLPDALAEVLPMFPAFEAKLVAEAHAAQDPAEPHPVALHALAVARVVPRR